MRRLQFKFPSQIRISGWDFGSSARAMNQASRVISAQAELVKVTHSTTERKSMSTKTTMKRIALVAVSALGFGMLSVVPSNAIVSGALTISASTAGSQSVTAGVADTSTPASLSVSGLLLSTVDSVSVSVVQKSWPTGGSAVKWNLTFVETTTSTLSQVQSSVGGSQLTTRGNGLWGNTAGAVADSQTSVSTTQSGAYYLSASAAGYAGATFGLLPDSTNANTKVAGTYVYTAIIQTYSNGALSNTQTQDLTFVISDTAANTALLNGTIDPSKTVAWMNSGTSYTTASDSSVVALATASASNAAVIRVNTYTSTSLAAPESVTVTLTGTAGVICSGSICGTSIKIAGDGSDDFGIRANGVAGTSTIVVATTTKTFPAKTVTFYAKSPSTITVSTNKPVIAVAAATTNTDVVRAIAKDANGNNWAGQLYVVASAAADALVAGSATTPTACTYNATYGFHACPLKGTAKGTATVKVMDATLDTDGTIATADAAVTSSATSVRVSTGAASSVKIAFDKASYTPGEKAYVTVRVLDENGDAMPAGAIANVFASAPTTNVALGTNSAAIGTTITIEGATDAATDTNSGAQTYVIYMPNAQGTVTYSATGSVGLAAAGRVAVSASAVVENADLAATNEAVTAAQDAANEATDAANAATDAANAAAEAADAATAAAQDAQAAVAELATQVASLIAGIKAQITSLTNLVIKIQKKVKA